MTRQDSFVLLVQTAALAREMKRLPWNRTNSPAGAVANAMCIPAECLPADLYKAAMDYVAYAYGDKNRPDWLPHRLDLTHFGP